MFESEPEHDFSSVTKVKVRQNKKQQSRGLQLEPNSGSASLWKFTNSFISQDDLTEAQCIPIHCVTELKRKVAQSELAAVCGSPHCF